MSRDLSRKAPYAVILILLCLIALVEAGHPFPSFRLATFILAFLTLAGMASLLRGKLRDGLVVLASLAFGLSMIEATAIISETKVSPPDVVTKGLWVSQPVIGWGPEHSGRFHADRTDPKSGVPIYSADYTIDSNLLRETHSVETGPTIVFFGDSYTFGEGLNDAETLPQVFADLLGRKQRVLNIAFGGYGPQQFLAELQTGRFDGVIGAQPRLFIFMTGPWHAARTACKCSWGARLPRYALENGQFVFKGDCYEGLNLWLRKWLENTASYRLFIEPYRNKVSHDDVDFYIRIVLAAVNLAKEKYGVATLIPYIADHDWLKGTGFSDDEIVQRFRDGGAMVVDVSLAKEKAAGAKLRIEGDVHPTPLANRLRASMLRDYIENRMPGILVAGLH
ncbi:MAG: SGNH/GDSL hydrolase family protein [Pseudomonadota bacterium]|nr:SGNH/GDSL hydrolase family protein [Pseudomonadota bacterium]